jgi:phage terminase small subunit
MDPMPKLDKPQWETYAKSRAAGLKYGKAWIAAGYDAKNDNLAAKYGRQLEKRHPEVTVRINDIIEETADTAARLAEVDREWVLKNLKGNYEKAAAEREVTDRQGNPTGEFVFNASGANRALELVGKELGMFVERFSIESLDSQLEGMSGDELRNFVKTAATEVGLRVVEMTDDEARGWILRTAPRLGLRVEESRDDPGSPPYAEDGGLSAVSEAEGVPPARRH